LIFLLTRIRLASTILHFHAKKDVMFINVILHFSGATDELMTEILGRKDDNLSCIGGGSMKRRRRR